ncbi:MAG: GTP-binding protein [Limnothrix sp.]
MHPIRLTLFFLGLSVVLGLMLWLVNSLYRLYLQVSFTAPFLANILILLLIGLIGLILWTFFRYFNLFDLKKSAKQRVRRSVTSSAVPQLPTEKTEAAAVNLQVIQQQVSQIQDKVAQKALMGRSQEIQANFERQELQVAVFGTGSAGKTSLVNALIGQMVGNVEATMGTTKIGKRFRLKLKGVAKQISITDTPGILEMGEGGIQRDELARQLATEADLLIFVVDNDLRQSEYDPLCDLAEIGKRSLLVFNKIDLYTEEDQEIIGDRLQKKVAHLIVPEDVIAVCASPQAFQLDNGDIIEPEPEVMPLMKRLAIVLRAEGDDLLADNLLLQSQRLGEEARRIIDSQRRKQADKVIERYQWIGAGVIAVTPLPVVDMLATAAVNAQMVMEIGQVYGCEIDGDRGKELALSLGKTLVSLGVVKGAVEMLAKVLQTNIATYFVGKAIQGVTAAYLTRIAGKSFVEYFSQDQEWGDGGIAEVVQQQFQLSKKDEFVKDFVGDAILKVVNPFKDIWQIEFEEDPERSELEWSAPRQRPRDEW